MDARHAAKAKREQGPQGLLDWARRYLPDHFKAAPSAMHQWIADQLEQMTAERGVKLNVLGPRCSAKSTVVTLAYVLRTALEGREPYIWILSDTKAQAYAHLENLKAELVDNELLAAAYPRAAGRGPVWRAGTIVLCNGVTIDALSTGQRIRGRRRREHRPTLIVCDDLQNDSHIDSAPMRERSRTWFHGTAPRRLGDGAAPHARLDLAGVSGDLDLAGERLAVGGLGVGLREPGESPGEGRRPAVL
jgi:hypothetical protein